MLNQIKAIVFDLDDTLCGHSEAVNIGACQTFKSCVPSVSEDILWKTWIEQYDLFYPETKEPKWYKLYLESGEPTRTELMRRTLKVHGIIDEVLVKQVSQTYMQNRAKALKLFPESLDVLERLKSKYQLGLLTNGPADIQRQEIAVLQIEHLFDGIWIEGECKIGKPLPKAFLNVEKELKLSPDEIMMVGNDAKDDIYPAIECGWKTAWIDRPNYVSPGKAYEEKPRVKEDGPQPDLIVKDLDHLLKALDI